MNEVTYDSLTSDGSREILLAHYRERFTFWYNVTRWGCGTTPADRAVALARMAECRRQIRLLRRVRWGAR